MVRYITKATGLFNPKFLCFYTNSGLSSARFDSLGEIIILSPKCENSLIGKAIKDCAAASRLVYPSYAKEVPEGAIIDKDDNMYDYKKSGKIYDEFIQSLMSQFNYKTKSALFRKMKKSWIDFADDNSSIKLVPGKKDRGDGWGAYAERQTITLSLPVDDETLGAAFRQSLKNAL